MSEVKHMNADDDKREFVTDITNPLYGLPVFTEKEVKSDAKRDNPPRALFIVDEAVLKDDPLYEKAQAWAKVIGSSAEMGWSTFCKPEFPYEAYSIENLLALSAKMKEERRKVDDEMKKSLKAYFKECGLKELMEFCQHMRVDGNSCMNHLNTDEPIPGWFYDRLKTWVESKKEKLQ